MNNNLISDEEIRKAKEKMNRLIDFRVKTKNYSWIKMDITGIIEDIKDYDVYIEGQEILSEG